MYLPCMVVGFLLYDHLLLVPRDTISLDKSVHQTDDSFTLKKQIANFDADTEYRDEERKFIGRGLQVFA